MFEGIRRLRMKKAGIIVAAGILLLAGLPAFSQAQAYPKDAYVKTVPIVKISVHEMGYKVSFFNSHQQLQDIYVPLTWFNKGPNSKADLIYDRAATFPYISVFWIDGKFDHVNIYVLTDFSSPTWDVLIAAGDLSNLFDVQDIPPNF
jgi:hypothetical protein